MPARCRRTARQAASAFFARIRRAWAGALLSITALAGQPLPAGAADTDAAAAPAVARTSAAGLPPGVQAALARAGLAAEALAVVVEAVAAPGRVASRSPPLTALQHRADQPIHPASLFKLVTTAAALELLGPAWQWVTPVAVTGPVRDGVLQGDLVIEGRGDPTLVLERLWLLLRRVQQAGVREIQGDIVLDRSAFDPGPHDPAAFDGEALRPYNAAADALVLNHRALWLSFSPEPPRGVARISVEPALDGVDWPAELPLASDGPCGDWRAQTGLQWTADSAPRFEGRYPAACGQRQWPLALPQSATSYEARLLSRLWQDLGGRLQGRVRDGRRPAGAVTLLEWASPPLAEVVRDINKHSSNLMAQQLFLTLGLQQHGLGSPQQARRVLQAWLEPRVGQAIEGLVIDNGSGLSRSTRLQPRLLARLLQHLWASPHMPELLASLPISGRDGSLRRTQAAHGRAHLKTGSLRDVSAVAGVVHAVSGRRYVLVAQVQHAAGTSAREVLDSLVQWVVDDGPATAAGGAPAARRQRRISRSPTCASPCP
jgi:serine-type D-Ala-D-Ala carboxypeptidase/endopeptidase (penicillin-binding protein 4)